MTNLEYRKEFIQKNKTFCQNAHILRYHRECGLRRCEDCEFRNVNECLKEMLRNVDEETIKLKQWEKDLFELSCDGESCFEDYVDFMEMKERGHFQGIVDTNMTIQEILFNCEVVE